MAWPGRANTRIAWVPGVIAIIAIGIGVVSADDSGRDEIAAATLYDMGHVDGAAALWRRAAEAGSRDAMVALGGVHESGEIGRRNVRAAVIWYRRAAALGDPVALYRLAQLTAAEPALTAEASDTWLRRAAEAGHPLAARGLAGCRSQNQCNDQHNTETGR